MVSTGLFTPLEVSEAVQQRRDCTGLSADQEQQRILASWSHMWEYSPVKRDDPSIHPVFSDNIIRYTATRMTVEILFMTDTHTFTAWVSAEDRNANDKSQFSTKVVRLEMLIRE